MATTNDSGERGSGAGSTPAGDWLDEREHRAWRGYLRANTLLSATLNRELQRHAELSNADYEVLVNLSEAADHRLRPFELGDAMQWEKSRLSHHLKRMEARGLVAREDCPSDARGAFVAVTDTGMAAITEAAPLHVADVRRYFIDVLTSEQLDALIEISDAVLAALEPDEDR